MLLQVIVTTQFGSRDLSVAASFQLDSPKRLKLYFEKGAVSQPTFNTTASLSSILRLVISLRMVPSSTHLHTHTHTQLTLADTGPMPMHS